MAKPLSAQERVLRLVERGHSRKQIGAALNRSAATVGRIARGQATGAALLPALKQVAARKPPPPGALVKPAPLAPAPPPPRPQPGEVRTVRPGLERIHVNRRTTGLRFDHVPTNKELSRALRGKTAQYVTLVITFTDGRQVRLLMHGWSRAKMLAAVEGAEEEWLLDFMEKERGYRGRDRRPPREGWPPFR